MRSILIILFLMLTILSAKSQSGKWLPGRFTDVKGNSDTGLIRIDPAGKGPIKDEGFIEFKENNKTDPFVLSASDLRYFVAGQDSFVVAHAPRNETWSKNELDFVRVAIDEDPKLYVARGGKGGGRGIGIEPEVGAGIGTGFGSGGGGFGTGFGGGISIPIGGGRRGGDKATYYYGTNPASLHRITDVNFEDIMSDMMGDEPDVVEKIHAKVYVLGNMEKLIAYFKQVEASHTN
jgi:hypothetical protein